jgi:hypothetical protein
LHDLSAQRRPPWYQLRDDLPKLSAAQSNLLLARMAQQMGGRARREP